jgi:ligand-binding sensor domain-containing protein
MLLMLAICSSCKGQKKTDLPKDTIISETKAADASVGPNSITRSIIQDRAGDIWMATWKGVYRYDGESFSNMTSEVSLARFFSVLEDRKGNLWFGSIGSGVFRDDGKFFQNFTTKDGLPNNEIVYIYEDQAGHIWFGVNGGVSRYDGESFRNYLVTGGSLIEDKTGKIVPDFTRPPDGVNAMVEDKAGRFWFATWGQTFVYDGKSFSVFSPEGKSFTNVRSIIEDRKGNIWLGGQNGLWRYNSSTLSNITKNFVGYIYEDTGGNIWTSSQQNTGGKWVLSRYDAKSLEDKNPTVSEIGTGHEGNVGMLFGILESNDGGIWFGALDGVYRYDGNAIIGFKGDKGQK